jgi:hypothetical protein
MSVCGLFNDAASISDCTESKGIIQGVPCEKVNNGGQGS